MSSYLVSVSNAKRGGLLEADSHVGLLEGSQHQFNMNNIYLQPVTLVSSGLSFTTGKKT
jgi:hypothetical protein